MKNRFNNLTSSQGFKAASLVTLTLIMLIPISMVNSLIRERSYRAVEVKNDISSDAGGILQFAGPLLKIPGTRKVKKTYVNSEGIKTTEYRDEDFIMWYAPEDLHAAVQLGSENKYRGIFYTPVFKGTLILKGNFRPDKFSETIKENETLHLQKAELVIPFFNQKGIRKVNKAVFNGSAAELYPGNRGLSLSPGGVYASAPVTEKVHADFDIELLVSGAEKVSILPIASSAAVEIGADWPAPSFSGLCLPDTHKISDEGFRALWHCSSLSSGLPLFWDEKKVFDSYALSSSYLNTDLINVHDHYEQNERAAKYAVLFILIPFITLFLFEHFFSGRIHIIQYILAATANIIFFLLLLSFSEHLSFNLSYFISASAVTIMMGLYSLSVLKDIRAVLMAPVMLIIYLFLFITLQSEDWALLIGSVGVFAITALIMLVTRKIDFYQSRQNQ